MTYTKWELIGLASLILPLVGVGIWYVHHLLTCPLCRWHKRQLDDSSDKGLSNE